MSRRRHYRRTDKEAPEMDITTFLNLMVVLVPFLLITAVFSRVTILELNLPTAAGGAQQNKPKLAIEGIVRDKGLEIGNGRSVVARFPKVNEAYDFTALSKHLLAIKRNYPEKTDATILMEPNIEYEKLVHVMDAIRLAELPNTETGEKDKFELFPDISIGDAP